MCEPYPAKRFAGLRKLPELNTVISKHNSVTDIGSTVRGCAALVKLSLAHNDVRALTLTRHLVSLPPSRCLQ